MIILQSRMLTSLRTLLLMNYQRIMETFLFWNMLLEEVII